MDGVLLGATGGATEPSVAAGTFTSGALGVEGTAGATGAALTGGAAGRIGAGVGVNATTVTGAFGGVVLTAVGRVEYRL